MVIGTCVKEAQVYRNGATITRSGRTELEKGKNTIWIAGMTETANQETFRLKVPQGVTALNIQLIGYGELGEENLPSKKLKRELEELSIKERANDVLYDKLVASSDFSDRQNVTVSEQEAYFDSLPAKVTDICEKSLAIKTDREKLTRQIKEAEKAEKKPLILMEVVSDIEGEVEFLLQYQDNAVNWKPRYEIHYTSDQDPLKVLFKGHIRQTTGEDWKQVKLTLYTGNPSVSHDIPQLFTETLDFWENDLDGPGMARGVGAFGNAKAMLKSNGVTEEAVADMAAPMVAMATREAEVVEEETMTAYAIPDPRDVEKGGRGNIADIQSFDIQAVFSVLVVPKKDSRGFMTAEIKGKDWPFMATEAFIYLKDVYAGSVFVDPEVRKETFTLSLGEDERLKVFNRSLPRKNQEGSLFKPVKTSTYTTGIKVVNTSSEPMTLTVKDQVPVSSNKSIEITYALSDGAVRNEETGEVIWKLTLEPKGSCVLKKEYTVTWPKDKKLRTHYGDRI